MAQRPQRGTKPLLYQLMSFVSLASLRFIIPYTHLQLALGCAPRGIGCEARFFTLSAFRVLKVYTGAVVGGSDSRPAPSRPSDLLQQICHRLHFVRIFRGQVSRFARVISQVVELGCRVIAEFRVRVLVHLRFVVRLDVFPLPLTQREPAGLLDQMIPAVLRAIDGMQAAKG